MKKNTTTLSIDHPRALDIAIEIIEDGGVIAFPTDTVYGIGVSAFNEYAVDKLFRVKGRSLQKAIPILIGDPKDLKLVALPASPAVAVITSIFWPGPLTLILPLHPDLPENLTQTDSIGVRVPDHEFTRELLRATGPLAVTSANLSGELSAITAEDVTSQLDGKIELILDGGSSPGGNASTVVELRQDQPIILREGPISLEEILQAIRG